MADILVLDWLEEFEAIIESEIATYASEQEHNHEVMIALYEIFTEPYRYKGQNLLDGICRQLLEFYRSGELQLRKFTFQYVPLLVFLHLADKSYSSVETLLLSLYNLEVVDLNLQPRTLSFRVPSIAQSSIYHDATTLDRAFIAENSLRRWEECNSKLVSWGPLPQVNRVNAQNRQRVITALVFLYNQQLANIISQGLEHTCRGISRIVSQGFNITDSARSSINSDCSYNQGITPRISLSSPLLLELLHTVYHGAEKGINGSIQALQDIIQRAHYEIYSDVLLAANAINNLIKHSSSLSPTPRPSQARSISKSMITNASFRTKKLPDDIPIQDEVQQEVPLDSITEEHEEGDKSKSKSSVSALKHLPKLPGLGKKHKVKHSQGHDQSVEMMTTVSGEGITETPSIDLNHTMHVSAV